MKNIIEVFSDTKLLKWKNCVFSCNLGASGVVYEKIEGDKCTPIGVFPIREILYRKDKIEFLNTKIKKTPIEKDFLWSDDPKDLNYNKLVKGPYEPSHEKLWRKDDAYDLIVVIGYNDNPVIEKKGSAIFLHCSTSKNSKTEGCVSLEKNNLIKIAESLEYDTLIKIL
tara:strand:+ start:21 stop:524 length:504 start_codon:yes stop_codon:yes gene_type:complete